MFREAIYQDVEGTLILNIYISVCVKRYPAIGSFDISELHDDWCQINTGHCPTQVINATI
jgi:hypothetical protein